MLLLDSYIYFFTAFKLLFQELMLYPLPFWWTAGSSFYHIQMKYALSCQTHNIQVKSKLI